VEIFVPNYWLGFNHYFYGDTCFLLSILLIKYKK
jgi:hypothetical protein